MTDYSFFEYSLAEQRTYRVNASTRQEMILRRSGELRVLTANAQDFVVRGTHLLRSGSKLGLARVNERLHAPLPGDADDFYRRWDGGLLLLRECYDLYSVEQIVHESLDADRYDSVPGRVVRFCGFSGFCEFVMRLNAEDRWEMLFAEPNSSDTEILQDTCSSTETFSGWLHRLCETDGWPPVAGWEEPDWLAERLDTA